MSYGIWTNQILNGSGNKYLSSPLSSEIEPQQFLRVFSLFDLPHNRNEKMGGRVKEAETLSIPFRSHGKEVYG